MSKLLWSFVLLVIFTSTTLAGFAGMEYQLNITCWADLNQNGQIDTDEPGIPGVLYRLESLDGDTLIAKHVTGSNGKLVFKIVLTSGDYKLYVNPNTLPADYVVTAGSLVNTFTSITFDVSDNSNVIAPQASLSRTRESMHVNYNLGIFTSQIDPSSEDVIPPPPPIPGNTLIFVEGSPTFKQGLKPGLWGWENIVDGDTSNFDTDAALFEYNMGSNPFAIFRFADNGLYKFNYVALQQALYNVFGWSHQISVPLQFKLWVSTTGYMPGDFASAGIFTVDFQLMPWVKQWFRVPAGFVTAKYVKLEILAGKPWGGVAKTSSTESWMTIAEFELQTGDKQGAIPAVEKENIINTTGFALAANYPNPFNPQTTIQYTIPQAELVTLTIYDVTGKQVAELINEQQQAGLYSVEWNAAAFPSGIYFYHIAAGEFKDMKRMILVK